VNRELSIRIDHEGASCYFPLGTARREEAAQRALQIYKVIISKGWEAATRQVSRELTTAFHWSDNPLAWTYTTIHTENSLHPRARMARQNLPVRGLQVAIAESDAGIRVALANCVNRMPGFECAAAFAKPGDALDHARHHSLHLVLIGQNAAEKPGAVYLEELRSVAPGVAGLIYSVHEDSEELFRTTPGGAGYYLLKRVVPTRFLEPIAEALERRSPGEITDAAWQYFKDTVFSSPIGGPTQELTNLTQREHEVLALLSKGHQDKSIAHKLCISAYTVHVHVRNIFEKLGVHNRTGAVVKYFQK
jgi:two-component system nitrate/nitrite response regulator NarL